MITAVELARRIGVDPKRLRAWLRGEVTAGNPLVAGHGHNDPWVFTDADATELARQFLARSSSSRSPASAEPGPSPTPLPADLRFDLEGLREAGFKGFVTFRELRAGRISEVPDKGGVYVVLHPEHEKPVFLEVSPGGWFKRKDPTVPVSMLRGRWVKGTPVIYIGKGDRLQRRLTEFMKFGRGMAIAHWGGRLVWQVRGSDGFLVAWKETSPTAPRDAEKKLLAQFAAAFGSRPLANLTG